MKKSGNEKQIMKKVLKYVHRHMPLVVISILSAAFVVALTLYLPILQGQAIDKIIGKGQVDLKGLVQILLIMGGAALITGFLQWLQNIINVIGDIVTVAIEEQKYKKKQFSQNEIKPER